MQETQAVPAPSLAGLMVLFAPGQRPDRAAIRSLLTDHARVRISHEPETADGYDTEWLELLSSGLSFDCLGLAPGPSLIRPEWRNYVGLEPGIDRDTAVSAIGIFAGPHIEAAAHILPVVRTQLQIARELVAGLPGVVAVGWTPAALLIAPEPFLTATDAWLAGQGFPALALVGLQFDADEALASDGLAFFSGQELRFESGVAADRVGAVHLAVRLIHELVAAQPVAEEQIFAAPSGEQLRLRPSRGGTLLSVSRV